MWRHDQVPQAVRAGVVAGYLKARQYPVNIWFDTDNLRFHVVQKNSHCHTRMCYVGKFHKIDFDDLLDELMFVFQNE